MNPGTKEIILPFRHGQYAGCEKVRECGGLPLTFPRGPRNFQWPISEVDGETLAWRGRTYKFVSKFMAVLKIWGVERRVRR